MEQETRAGFRRGIRARLRPVPASDPAGLGRIRRHCRPPFPPQRRSRTATDGTEADFSADRGKEYRLPGEVRTLFFLEIPFFGSLLPALFSRAGRKPAVQGALYGLPFFPAAGPVLLPGRRILRMPPAHRPRSVHSGPASFLQGPAGCTGPSGGTLQSTRRRYSIALEMEPAFCRRDLLRRTGQIRTARGGEQRQPRRSSGPITVRPRQLHLGSLPEAGQFFPAGTESSVRIPDLLSDSRSPLALYMRVRAGLPAGADLQLWRKAEPGMTGKGRSSSPGTAQTGG